MPRARLPALQLSLQFADSRHRAALPRHCVARWIRAALDAPAQITVRIVDADEGRALNRDFRGKDYATNVLTFAYGSETDAGSGAVSADGTAPLSADLLLCAPVVEAEAAAAKRPLVAHYAHLLVHGTLHAQGWDHEHENQAQAMEARETAILATLGFDDPYASGPAHAPARSRAQPAAPRRAVGARGTVRTSR